MQTETGTAWNNYTDKMRKLANGSCYLQASWQMWLMSEEEVVVVASHPEGVPERHCGDRGAR